MKTVITNDENPAAQIEKQDRSAAPDNSVIEMRCEPQNKFLFALYYASFEDHHDSLL